MAKINRRDYLKRMAAGGGILAGASNLNLFQLTPAATLNAQKKPKAGNILPVAAALNWPLTNTSPILTPFVSVILDGLMGFFYDGPSKTCKVGFHAGHGDHSFAGEVEEFPFAPVSASNT
jgi:hypothetical protein